MEDVICMGISTGSGSRGRIPTLPKYTVCFLLPFGQIFPTSCVLQLSTMKKKRKTLGKSNVKHNRFSLFILIIHPFSTRDCVLHLATLSRTKEIGAIRTGTDVMVFRNYSQPLAEVPCSLFANIQLLPLPPRSTSNVPSSKKLSLIFQSHRVTDFMAITASVSSQMLPSTLPSSFQSSTSAKGNGPLVPSQLYLLPSTTSTPHPPLLCGSHSLALSPHPILPHLLRR